MPSGSDEAPLVMRFLIQVAKGVVYAAVLLAMAYWLLGWRPIK